MGKNVGIVIVSHSPDVAKGAADMVRQMVGAHVPLAGAAATLPAALAPASKRSSKRSSSRGPIPAW